VTTRASTLAALEALAESLGPEAWATVLTTGGSGHTPRLHVINRAQPALASDIYAEGGWYWWPHAERIARTSTPDQAVATITHTLSTITSPAASRHQVPGTGHPASQPTAAAALPKRTPPHLRTGDQHTTSHQPRLQEN
jgi:hypothetical protein